MSIPRVPFPGKRGYQTEHRFPKPNLGRPIQLASVASEGVKNQANLHFLRQAKNSSFRSGIGYLVLSMITNAAFSTFNVNVPSILAATLVASHDFMCATFPAEPSLWNRDSIIVRVFQWLYLYTFENKRVILIRSVPFYISLLNLGVSIWNIATVNNFRKQGFFSSSMLRVFRILNATVSNWLGSYCATVAVPLIMHSQCAKVVGYISVMTLLSFGNWVGVLSNVMQMSHEKFQFVSMDPHYGIFHTLSLAAMSALSVLVSLLEVRLLKVFCHMALLVLMMRTTVLFFRVPSYYGLITCLIAGALRIYMLMNGIFVMFSILVWDGFLVYRVYVVVFNLSVAFGIATAIFWKRKQKALNMTMENVGEWTESMVYDLLTLCGLEHPLFMSVEFHEAVQRRWPNSVRLAMLSDQVLMLIPGQMKNVFKSTLRFAWKWQYPWVYKMKIRVMLELATPAALPSEKWSSVVEQQVVEVVEKCQTCHANFWSALMTDDRQNILRKARILHNVVSKTSDFFQQIEQTRIMTHGMRKLYLSFLGEISADPKKTTEYLESKFLMAENEHEQEYQNIDKRMAIAGITSAQYEKLKELQKNPRIMGVVDVDKRQFCRRRLFMEILMLFGAILLITVAEVGNLVYLRHQSTACNVWARQFSLIFEYISHSIHYDLKHSVSPNDPTEWGPGQQILSEMKHEILSFENNWTLSMPLARIVDIYSQHNDAASMKDVVGSRVFQDKLTAGVELTRATADLLHRELDSLEQKSEIIHRRQKYAMMLMTVVLLITVALHRTIMRTLLGLLNALLQQAYSLPLGHVAQAFKFFQSRSKSFSRMSTMGVWVASYTNLMFVPVIFCVMVLITNFGLMSTVNKHMSIVQNRLRIICSFPVYLSGSVLPFLENSDSTQWERKQQEYCFIANIMDKLVKRHQNVSGFLATCLSPEIRQVTDSFTSLRRVVSTFKIPNRAIADILVALDFIIPANVDNFRAIESRASFVSPSAVLTAFQNANQYGRMMNFIITVSREKEMLVEMFYVLHIIFIWVMWAIQAYIHYSVFVHVDSFSGFFRRILTIVPNVFVVSEEYKGTPQTFEEIQQFTSKVLNALPCGVVILDENMDRTYDNKFAQTHLFPVRFNGRHEISSRNFQFRSTPVSHFPLRAIDNPLSGVTYVSFVDVTDIAQLETSIARLAKLRKDYEQDIVPEYFRSSHRNKLHKHESFVFTQCAFIMVDIPHGRTRELETRIGLVASGRPTFMHMDPHGSFIFVFFVSMDTSNPRLAGRDAFYGSYDIYDLLMNDPATSSSRVVAVCGSMLCRFTTGAQLSLMTYSTSIAKACRILGATGYGQLGVSSIAHTCAEVGAIDRKASCQFNGATVPFYIIEHQRRSQSMATLNV